MNTDLARIERQTALATVDLVDGWLAYLVGAENKAAATVDTYRRGIEVFRSWLQETGNLGAVTPATVMDFKAELMASVWDEDTGKTYSVQTINLRLAAVKSFYSWLVNTDRLAVSPAREVKGFKRVKGHRREALTNDEVRRVLAQPDTDTDIGKRDAALLCLLAYTGVRSIEVRRAKVGDLRGGKLWLWGKGRTEADRYVHLVNQTLTDALYSWMAVHPRGGDLAAPLFCGMGRNNTGGMLTGQALRAVVKEYYRAAGVRDPRKTTHSLRHSLVTNLIRHGVPALKIMSMTGHESLETLRVYSGEVERDLDPAEGYVDYGEV